MASSSSDGSLQPSRTLPTLARRPHRRPHPRSSPRVRPHQHQRPRQRPLLRQYRRQHLPLRLRLRARAPAPAVESSTATATGQLGTVAPAPASNLDGVPPEMLRALLQACHAVDPGEAASTEEAAALQRALSLCMHEIRRQGVFQVSPPGWCPWLWTPHHRCSPGHQRPLCRPRLSQSACYRARRRSSLQARTSSCASARLC